jgi:hypothetical protein
MSEALSQKIEHDVRHLIGDLHMQVIVLRAALDMTQPQEQPKEQPNPVIRGRRRISRRRTRTVRPCLIRRAGRPAMVTIKRGLRNDSCQRRCHVAHDALRIQRAAHADRHGVRL